MLLKKKTKKPKNQKNKPNRSMRKTEKGIYTPPSKNKKKKSPINNLTYDLKESENTKPKISSQQEGNNKDQEENKLRLKKIEKKENNPTSGFPHGSEVENPTPTAGDTAWD